MKYYIYVLLLCLLLALAQHPASAAGPSADMPTATSYQLSSVAKATDSVSGEFSPGPGKIAITRDGSTLFIRVPGPAGSGTRLASLDDAESGITFRNNTLLLPLYAAGEKSGTLIVATDNLTADSYGYAGAITGLELDSRKIAAARDGQNFTATAILSLADLPAGATYRVSFGDNGSLAAAVAADLEASGLALAAASPPLEVSASSPSAVGFVIVTIAADESWAGAYDNNVTLYRRAGGQLARLRPSIIKSQDGGLVYQAMAPGGGQFVLAAGNPRSVARETAAADHGGFLILGGVLAALLIALAAMIRRVRRR